MFVEDVLNDPKGECVICLDDLNAGDIIARLPCLCVYHKGYVINNLMNILSTILIMKNFLFN